MRIHVQSGELSKNINPNEVLTCFKIGAFWIRKCFIRNKSAESDSLKDGSPDSIIKLESKGLSTNKQSFQPAWYQCFISDFVRFCSFLFYLQPY